MVLNFGQGDSGLFPQSSLQNEGIGSKQFNGEGIASIAGNQFMTGTPASESTTYLVGDLIIGGNNITAQGTIQLPDGARILQGVLYGNISDETWSLIKIILTSGATANVFSSTNFNTINSSPAAGTEIVDNSKYAYIFRTSTMDNGDRLHSAQVKYIIEGATV